MHLIRTVTLTTALLLVPPAPAVAQAGDEPLPPNPFSVFESVRLPNGLRVFYGHLSGATIASMAVVVPYGGDRDPPGREQTAHFLEHVLLSDRAGRTEAQLARDLAARGGTFTGVTGPDYTAYSVSLPTEHAAVGVQWLHDVIAPRPLPDSLIDANREPVAAELRARHRWLFPDPAALLPGNRRLRPPGFWQREFGHAAQEERTGSPLASLAKITPSDVRAFYDAHYGPSVMTLIIVSGRPLAELEPVLVETFATLPWRPTPGSPPLAVRSQETRRFAWRPGPGTRLTLRYRVTYLNGLDHLRLIFLEDLLRERLTQRLRTGSAKTAYGVQTGTEIRGAAAYFGLTIDMDPRHEATVRAAIDQELDRLRIPSSDTAAFYADRDALNRTLRVEFAAPGSLRQLAMQRFSRPAIHDAFPDLGEYYATVGPDSIAAFADRLLAADNRILSISRPLPWHPTWLLAIAASACFAAARLYRHLALRPADMTAIRFVARLRGPLPARLTAAALATVAVLFALRVGAAGIHAAAERFIFTVDSFPLHAGAAASLLFVAMFTALACLGLGHRKVLVFDDEIRLKSPTYRATVIRADDVRSVRVLQGQPNIRLRRPVLGSAAGSVLLELHDGTGYVLHVRDAAALQRAGQGALDRRRAAQPAAGSSPPAPADPSPAPVDGSAPVTRVAASRPV